MEKRLRRVALAGVFVIGMAPLTAQTKVDLRNQSRNVDFTNAASTKPVKAGTSLPAACVSGELFFHLTAPAGANLYACAASNTWSLETGALTVENNGVVVGTRNAENFVTGAGMVTAISDTGTKVNVQQIVDTAVIQTKANAQSGAALLCASSGGSSTTYSCAMNPILNSYTTGMIVQWRPDVNGTGGGTTLNIDTLGPKAVRLADGVTDPTAADVVGGRLHLIWFDGTVFRLVTTAMNAGTTAPRPGCDVSRRGRIWQVPGGDGVKDELAVCAKDAAGTYAWRALY